MRILPPLFRKELRWARRHLLAILILVIVLPGLFAYGSLAFETVLPTDAPVALVPQSDAVTAGDRTITEGAVAPFADPVHFASTDRAFRALERERVYAVVTYPAGITDPDGPAVFEVVVSGSVVPYHEASRAVVSVMNFVLENQLPAELEVTVERTVLGEERSLSEYLLPTFVFVLVMLLALVYLPYVLATEAPVVDRVRIESSLTAAIGWKLGFFTLLSLGAVGVFGLVSYGIGYDIALLAPGALVVYALTFLALGAIGSSVLILSGFSTLGRLLDVLLLFGLASFSGLFYPAGFFSPIRRELVRVVPTHYAMVAIRGFTLRGSSVGAYRWWILALAALTIFALGLLRASIAVYERRA